MVNPAQAVHDPLPSPSVSGNRKKQKMNPSGHSQSFGGPPQHVLLPTPSSARRAPVTGPKGKNKKSHPPSGSTTGRAQLGNRVTSGAHANETAETPSFSPLIGRKVRTRWPDDNNFYEATITDYNSKKTMILNIVETITKVALTESESILANQKLIDIPNPNQKENIHSFNPDVSNLMIISWM
ncbi:putative protein EMSY-LIKE, plant [Helianthus annuus]|nr:putative protein EMSY-LIKE, plant [Helianthus annuus]